MQSTSKYSIGLQFGLIAALVYCILLFLRYNFFGHNPVTFALFTAASYAAFLVILFFAGRARKQQQGGYAETKDIFQTILIVIVITELAYVLFNFIYLKYVDPQFFTRFIANYRDLMEKAHLTQDKIDQQMETMKDLDKQMSVASLFKGIATWILVDSIFGLIFAAILKKRKDIFEEPQTI